MQHSDAGKAVASRRHERRPVHWTRHVETAPRRRLRVAASARRLRSSVVHRLRRGRQPRASRGCPRLSLVPLVRSVAIALAASAASAASSGSAVSEGRDPPPRPKPPRLNPRPKPPPADAPAETSRRALGHGHVSSSTTDVVSSVSSIRRTSAARVVEERSGGGARGRATSAISYANRAARVTRRTVSARAFPPPRAPRVCPRRLVRASRSEARARDAPITGRGARARGERPRAPRVRPRAPRRRPERDAFANPGRARMAPPRRLSRRARSRPAKRLSRLRRRVHGAAKRAYLVIRASVRIPRGDRLRGGRVRAAVGVLDARLGVLDARLGVSRASFGGVAATRVSGGDGGVAIPRRRGHLGRVAVVASRGRRRRVARVLQIRLGLRESRFERLRGLFRCLFRGGCA